MMIRRHKGSDDENGTIDSAHCFLRCIRDRRELLNHYDPDTSACGPWRMLRPWPAPFAFRRSCRKSVGTRADGKVGVRHDPRNVFTCCVGTKMKSTMRSTSERLVFDSTSFSFSVRLRSILSAASSGLPRKSARKPSSTFAFFRRTSIPLGASTALDAADASGINSTS